ncbi:hypothetical protein A5790_14585 [Mycobacterium sp. 852002-51152_SCH6134967]|uniref:hypothetical protein n=1 Tax=Mycobacterium sp. 852002-51152_SCH6134967 TaxID=1834096 RepID=UPI0007FC9A53|nr:hypothetical protein [Mycobacterium sp. 852002-51152_SCH6134967]OBF92366.1 hypothetical protein A5790_14585 [Mycobacterium sp. 852002-51152_SCH6134967]
MSAILLGGAFWVVVGLGVVGAFAWERARTDNRGIDQAFFNLTLWTGGLFLPLLGAIVVGIACVGVANRWLRRRSEKQ